MVAAAGIVEIGFEAEAHWVIGFITEIEASQRSSLAPLRPCWTLLRVIFSALRRALLAWTNASTFFFCASDDPRWMQEGAAVLIVMYHC